MSEFILEELPEPPGHVIKALTKKPEHLGHTHAPSSVEISSR
jgi:hypothetical protein